jgi:hypothetical protein
MATHELYVGGPSSQNYSRAMFPAVPFNASDDAFKRVTVAAHKGPTSYALSRVLDTTDTAFAEYLRSHTVAQGDVIGSILIPQGTLVKGAWYRLVNPQGTATTTITPGVRGMAAASLPAIAANGAAGTMGFCHFGDSAWIAANGFVAVDGAAAGAVFFATPAILDLTLTTLPASKFGNMRLEISLLAENMYHGQF